MMTMMIMIGDFNMSSCSILYDADDRDRDRDRDLELGTLVESWRRVGIVGQEIGTVGNRRQNRRDSGR